MNHQEMPLDQGSEREELTGKAHRQPRIRGDRPLGKIKELPLENLAVGWGLPMGY